MARYAIITIVVLLLGVDNGACADDAIVHSQIQTAIDALKQAPTHPNRIETLVRAAVASENTSEQARALAICYLGYCLAGNSNNANAAKKRLLANRATTVYRDYVRDDRLFGKTICSACHGTGALKTRCSKCSSGTCTDCKGRGKNPGLKSMISCTSCKGSGRCRFCSGTRSLSGTCQNCSGGGNLVAFKREKAQELYLSLLQKPLDSSSSETAEAFLLTTATGKVPIILEESTIQRFQADYDASTSLNKHAVYQAFLRQIGSEEANPSPLLIKVPDGVQFVVKDVSIGIDHGRNVNYYAMVESRGYGIRKLIFPERDKEFAASLQKGMTLTSSGWVKPLAGLPQRGTGENLYRSVKDYLTARDALGSASHN